MKTRVSLKYFVNDCGPAKVERLVWAGVLADTKNLITMSVWGALTETINESKTYKFRNVTCDSFNGLKISTNPSTIVYSIEHRG